MQLLSSKIIFVTFSPCDSRYPMFYVGVFYLVLQVSFNALNRIIELLENSRHLFQNGTQESNRATIAEENLIGC